MRVQEARVKKKCYYDYVVFVRSVCNGMACPLTNAPGTRTIQLQSNDTYDTDDDDVVRFDTLWEMFQCDFYCETFDVCIFMLFSFWYFVVVLFFFSEEKKKSVAFVCLLNSGRSSTISVADTKLCGDNSANKTASSRHQTKGSQSVKRASNRAISHQQTTNNQPTSQSAQSTQAAPAAVNLNCHQSDC